MGFHREGISGRWPGYTNSSVAPLLTPSGMSAIYLHLSSPIKKLFSPSGTYLFCPGLADQYSFGLYIAIL